MTSPRPLLKIALTALALCALFATAANAELARQARADANASAFRAAKVNIPVRDPGPPPGAQVLTYKFGPMHIQPGQNLINVDLQKERPDVDGYIVGFRPGLVYTKNGKSPSVKVVHLHHAVWLVGDGLLHLKPTFAAGEEKTYFNAPPGFGWRYTTKQTWVLNHMIHDLVNQPAGRVPHLHAVLHPGHGARGGEHHADRHAVDGRRRASSPTRSSTR